MFLDFENRNSHTDKVFEVQDGFYILIEMAGVKKEDLSIEAEGNEIIIEAERKAENKPYSFRTGKISRRYYLDTKSLSSEGIKAILEDGVLEVYVPKQAHRITKKIQIN